MPGMSWQALLNSPNPVASGTALASSTTLTDISQSPPVVLPANMLVPGSVLRFTAFGRFSTTGTPTLLLGVYYGGVAGVALAASTAITTGSGVANVPFRIELQTTIRAIGSAGSAFSQGFLDLGTSVSAVSHVPLPQTANAAVTIDTTTAKALTVGAQWGTSSASNTITLDHFYAESLGL